MAINQSKESSDSERRITMTILVTGATGFVGRHVTRLLSSRGDNVRVLLRPGSQFQALEDLPLDRAYGDLRDPSSLRKALAGVNQVFHVAADYRLWAKKPNEIYESNVQGTRNLIEESRESGVERFIYTSSVATIGPPPPGALSNESTETRLDQMIGHYKRSKFRSEEHTSELQSLRHLVCR